MTQNWCREWAPLLRIRDEALKLLEAMRKAGTIGAPLDAAISLGADAGSESALAETIKQYREELKDLFIVSEVAILGDAEAAEIRRKPAAARTSPSMAASREPPRIPQSRWLGVTRPG